MENLFYCSCPSPGAPSEEGPNHIHMSAAVSLRHPHPTRAGGETQIPANRLPFRQDKGKHETDEGQAGILHGFVSSSCGNMPGNLYRHTLMTQGKSTTP